MRGAIAALGLVVTLSLTLASLEAQRPLRFRVTSVAPGTPDSGTLVWDCGLLGVNYPTCAADSVDADGALWDRSLQLAVGPQGQNAVRIDHVGTTDTGAEYYHGKWDWVQPVVAQGGCVYIREIIRFNAPIDWNDDGLGRFGFKHVVVGEDGALDTNRGFINFRSDLTVPADIHEPTQVLMRIEKNVEGPPSRTDVHDLVAGVWYFIQTGFCSSSTAVATDATIKTWVNTNVFASPTAQSSGGFAWPVTGWTRVALGFYGESLGVGHHASYDIAGFVVDDAFNASFYVP